MSTPESTPDDQGTGIEPRVPMSEDVRVPVGPPSELPMDADAVAAHHDALAADYDRLYTSWGYDLPRRAMVLMVQHAPRSSRVLDLGCGTGLSGRALWESGFIDVDGVDVSAASLAQARAKGNYGCLLACRLDGRLPFIDADYDAALCVGVLEYVPGHGLLEEMCRVTRPGGMVVFTQRDDRAAACGFEEALEALEEDGRWEWVYESEPLAYLPGHEGFRAAGVTVRLYGYRVLA